MKEITMDMLKELECDPEFIAGLRNADSNQEVLELLADRGIDLTEAELEAGHAQAVEAYTLQGYIQNGEFTEKGLELVCGGVNDFLCTSGIAAGTAGLLLMMSGPVIAPGAAALWAGGCLVSTIGLFTPSKKKKNKKKK